jgi:hypothetical protein
MSNEFKVRKGLIVNGSGSIIFDVQGSQGELFSVTDSLSGSLFSVNDISGIPILNVSSNNSVVMGTYGAYAISVSGSVAKVSGSFTGSLVGNADTASAANIFNANQITASNVSIGALSLTSTLSSTSTLRTSNVGSGFGVSVVDTNNYLTVGTSGGTSISNASIASGISTRPTQVGVGSVIGILVQPLLGGSFTNSTSLTGVQAGVRAANASASYARAFEAVSPTINGTSSISINTGLYINAQSASAVLTGYGIYQASLLDLNYFAGNLGLGPNKTLPTAQLDVSGSTSLSGSLNASGSVTFSSLGTGTVSATSGLLSTTSDMTLKIEDGYIDNALEKVLKLTPRYFHWKEESGLPAGIRQLGFYAQEVNLALGEETANTPRNENEKWGIYDRGIVAFLTKAIQELKAEFDEYKSTHP